MLPFLHTARSLPGLLLGRMGLLVVLVGTAAPNDSDPSGIPPVVKHWSFSPPRWVAPPPLLGVTTANPIDSFILEKIRERGLTPASAATRPELLRRVTYDLTGLPPTPAELQAFLSDDSPQAWDRVVDRLLASPRYGERWAQHWLDLAHYADSNGFELDADRPDAWRYRDWVIRAFNDDLPYDQFLTLQVAGDEAEPGNQDAWIASGFGRAGPREVVAGNIDPEVRRQDELTEVTTSVGSVFLGLTVGCARCHDHKFDPFPSVDYYGLEAYFAGTHLIDVPLHNEREKLEFDRETARIESLIKPIAEAKDQIEAPYRAQLARLKEMALTPAERAVRAKKKEDRTPEEQRLAEGTEVALDIKWEEVAEAVAQNPADWKTREELKRRIYELELHRPRPLAHAMAMTEGSGSLPPTHLLKRGNVKDKRAVVEPHPPQILEMVMGDSSSAAATASRISPNHSGRRLALARWLTATNNPLTARVIVNRLWQHHFGRGIVATTSDFGVRGDPPTHPELLDWLAGELLRNGWRLKPLHRWMVMSEAYQRSSRRVDEETVSKDPGNLFLARMNHRRLDAEGLRDAILASSDTLNSDAGGPGNRIELEPEVRSLIFSEQEVVELWPAEPVAALRQRRSVYVYRKRNVHYPLFDAFDSPDALTPCPVRPVSTHAPQALVLMNSGFAWDSAQALAQLLCRASSEATERIADGFLRCYARPPAPSEIGHAMRFIGDDPSRWTDFALALLNSNEFAYVP